MPLESKIDIDKWKMKRKSTLVIYTIQYFVNGAEQSINISTLWLYVTSLMGTNSPGTFYALISASVFLPPILFGPLLARYADRTRNVKFCLIFGNSIAMLGSILYVIPFSPYCALCGRFLQGFMLALRSLMVGEIARSFPSSETQYYAPILSIVQLLGFSLAPALVIFLQRTNFWIGTIHITYANVTGVVILGFVILLQVLIILFAHNLSAEYDLKGNEPSEVELNRSSSSTSLGILKDIFTHRETFLMIAYTFAMELPCLLRALPVFIISIIHYEESFVNMVVGLYGAITIIISMVLITNRIISPEVSYYLGNFSLLALMFISPIMLTLSMNIPNYGVNVTLLILTAVLKALYYLGDHLFTQVTMIKLARSSNQCYVESIRQIAKRMGNIIGSLIIVSAVYNLLQFCLILSAVAVLFIFLLARQSDTLMNPTPVI